MGILPGIWLEQGEDEDNKLPVLLLLALHIPLLPLLPSWFQAGLQGKQEQYWVLREEQLYPQYFDVIPQK